MRKCLIAIIALGLVIAFSSVSFSKDLKIAYVNIFEVFNEYDKTKDYDEVLEQKKEKEKVKLDAKKEEIKKIQEKLNLLKDNAKKKEQEKIANVAQEYREMERKIFIDLKKERDKKMEEIVDDINKVIKDYARKNGFDLVVNQNTVLYGAKSMDITSQILKEVNKQYKKRR